MAFTGYELRSCSNRQERPFQKDILGSYPPHGSWRRVGHKENHFIHDGYQHRQSYQHFDDTDLKDEWQREIYQLGSELCRKDGLPKVCDIGCGSGYKLLKYFSPLRTLGIEVSPTYEWLLKRYPNRSWMKSDFHATLSEPYDLVIAADVIEHLLNPDELLRFIGRISFRYAILSTPDRDLLPMAHYGPPSNPAHIREWSFAEFEAYIAEYFQITEHFISNSTQATQAVVCGKR